MNSRYIFCIVYSARNIKKIGRIKALEGGDVMVNKLKRLILIITLFAVIIAAFHLKLNPKLTVFSEEYQSNDISKFDVELTSLLINKLNQLEIPGMQVAIKINDELHHYNIGTIDYKRTKKK